MVARAAQGEDPASARLRQVIAALADGDISSVVDQAAQHLVASHGRDTIFEWWSEAIAVVGRQVGPCLAVSLTEAVATVEGCSERLRVVATVEPEPPHGLVDLAWHLISDEVDTEAEPGQVVVSGSLPDDVVDRLTDFAARTQRAETLPALVIGAMTTAGSGTLCLGVAENDPAVPATPTTRFRLSSLIKPFTAVAVLQLVEEGLLDPDEPVVAHLNGIALPGDITVRQLLTHTSGLLRYYGYFHVDAAEAIPDLVDYYREHPLQRREGDHLGYEYSNHNYAVLGQLVEEMRGRPYADVVGDGVLEPLGMTMTTFDDRADGATGYALEGGAVIPSPVYRPVLTPASGGWGTLDDLLRFLGFFVHPAPSPVLGAATTSLMRTNQSPVPGHRRGLGFALESLDGADVVSHIGGWPGYCGAVAFVPDEGIGVALLANRSTEARSDLPHGMLRCVLDSA